MADKHPYVSANGSLLQVLDHLKKSFPSTLDADVLRKLGFAPKNESYVINTLRFINLIDEHGGRTEQAHKIFTLHDSANFEGAFSALIKSAYSDLFKLHGDGAWKLDNSKLITYFRQTDQSTELVGTRQASTFRTLAGYGGQAAPSFAGQTTKPKGSPNAKSKSRLVIKHTESDSETPNLASNNRLGEVGADRILGLTVRIEINLPATGEQDTYDKIFKSIRENLLNG